MAPVTSSEPTTGLVLQENTPQISRAEVVRAATNDPSLSFDEFVLGGKTYKIVDLPYDDYIRFVALLQPVLDAVMKGVAEHAMAAEVPDDVVPPVPAVSLKGLGIADIVRGCVVNLPEMVAITCSQTDPAITKQDVKKMAKSPFELARIVLMQIARNNIIKDFTDFFVQILPLLKTTLPAE